ncbi:MAG: HAMP domain-containing protein [Oscillatoriales cyanobacterium SM2_1_8]|nr:HAMP domain-containing protein [Oscillatoriales cyanobacterium SM2_1_8]
MAATYQQALEAYEAGQYNEAMQLFSELLKQDPRNPRLHIWLGATFRAAGKVEYAKWQYQQVIYLTRDAELVEHAQNCLSELQNTAAEPGTPIAETGLNAGSENRGPAVTPRVSHPASPPPTAPDETMLAEAPVVAKPKIVPAPPNGTAPKKPAPTPIEPEPPIEPAGELGAEFAGEFAGEFTKAPEGFGGAAIPRPKPVSTQAVRLGTLKTKLLFGGLVFAVIPATALSLLVRDGAQIRLQRQSGELTANQAQAGAQAIASTLERQRQDVRLLGNLIVPFPMQPRAGTTPQARTAAQQEFARKKTELRGRLSLYRRGYATYERIAVFDLQGKPFAQSDGTMPLWQPSAEFLQALRQNTDPAIGSPVTVGDTAMVPIGRTLSMRGQPAAFLIAQVPLAKLGLPAEGSSAIVDKENRTVFGTGLTIGSDATASFPILTKLENRETQAHSRVGGKMYGYAPIAGDLGWSLAIASEGSPSDIGDIFLLGIGLLLVSAVVALVASAVAERVTYPIERVILAMRRAMNGELDTRVPVAQNEELSELSSSLNDLLDNVQHWQQERQQNLVQLQQQVEKLFRALGKAAGVSTGGMAVSDESVNTLLKKVGTRLNHKEAELRQFRHDKEALEQKLDEVRKQIEHLAKEVLRLDVPEGSTGIESLLQLLANRLAEMMGRVRATATETRQTLTQAEQALGTVQEGAAAQEDRIAQTLTSVQDMAVAAERLAASAQQAAAATAQSRTTLDRSDAVIEQTVQGILSLRATVDSTLRKIKRLGDSSRRIYKVVSLINDLSVQTNYLAINASIEARKAGVGGRGFALIAEEVGVLASRAAAATKEVEQLIATIQSETVEAISAMEQGNTHSIESAEMVSNAQQELAQMKGVAQQIETLVRSMSAATAAQTQTSQAVATLMQELAQASNRSLGAVQHASKSLGVSAQLTEQLYNAVEPLPSGRQG